MTAWTPPNSLAPPPRRPATPGRTLIHGLAALALLAGAGCTYDTLDVGFAHTRHDLRPVDEFREDGYIARQHPQSIEVSSDGATLFVGLAGTLLDPGHEVLAVNATDGAVRARIPVASSPQGLVLSQDGRTLYVLCQLSNVISVIDTDTLEAVSELPVSFYAQDAALSNDGTRLYVTNRWLDAVEVVTLDAPNGRTGRVTGQFQVGTNPRDAVLSEDGKTLYVGNLSATSVSVVDLTAGRETTRVHTNSPVNGLARAGRFLVVATLGRGDGHPATAGATEGHLYRGDGTAALGFADINNDLVVLDTTTDTAVFRYTSDTALVSEEDVPGDYTPEELIVEGALPEQAAAFGDRVAISMSASDQVQVLDANPQTGRLTPFRTFDVGMNPWELAFSPDGSALFVADRLGESVTRIDLASGATRTFPVGVTSPPYPANDYETGERLFHSALFSSEALPSAVFPQGTRAGDRSCAHCHRESLTDGKVWSVAVGALTPVGGERMPPSARNVRDTQLLFWEGVQSEKDFDLETNEFAPLSDFEGDTPEERAAARDTFFLAQIGYTFDDVGRYFIGKFLVGRPRLLPNPMAQFPTTTQAAAIARGRALFESESVGCSVCHPAPFFTNNNNIDPVISRSPLDHNIAFKVDQVTEAFNVPSIRGVWDRPSIYFHDGRGKSIRSALLPPGHTSLRADRDGCHKLGEENGTLGGEVFRPVYNGRGCNEVNGAANTHGNTTQLTEQEVQDLVLYVFSIE